MAPFIHLLGGVQSVGVNLSRFSIDSTGLGARLVQWTDLILGRMALNMSHRTACIDFHQPYGFFDVLFVHFFSVPSSLLTLPSPLLLQTALRETVSSVSSDLSSSQLYRVAQ